MKLGFCHSIPPFSTQCLQNSTENVERSVLTLFFLYQPWYVRDTAFISYAVFFRDQKGENRVIVIFFRLLIAYTLKVVVIGTNALILLTIGKIFSYVRLWDKEHKCFILD